MLGKDKRIVHLEEKVSDLKEARSKRAEAVSTLLTQTTSFIKCLRGSKKELDLVVHASF